MAVSGKVRDGAWWWCWYFLMDNCEGKYLDLLSIIHTIQPVTIQPVVFSELPYPKILTFQL